MKISLKTALILFSGIATIGLYTSCNNANGKNLDKNKDETTKITILQTADIHGQLDSHPELFWEDEEIVFKERGGLAHIQTLFEEEQADSGSEGGHEAGQRSPVVGEEDPPGLDVGDGSFDGSA